MPHVAACIPNHAVIVWRANQYGMLIALREMIPLHIKQNGELVTESALYLGWINIMGQLLSFALSLVYQP